MHGQYIPVGAELVGIGADDLEELSEDDAADYYKLGAEDDEFKDYGGLALKPDHANRWRMQLVMHHACAQTRPRQQVQQLLLVHIIHSDFGSGGGCGSGRAALHPASMGWSVLPFSATIEILHCLS